MSKHSGSCLAQNALSRACLYCPCSWGQRPRSLARAQEGRGVEAGDVTRLRRCIKSSCSEAKGVPARRSSDARPQDHSMECTEYPPPSGKGLANSPPQLRPKVPWSKRAPHNLQGALTEVTGHRRPRESREKHRRLLIRLLVGLIHQVLGERRKADRLLDHSSRR